MSQNKNSTLQNLLYSVVGVIGVLIILIAANAILARMNLRADLTEEKVYTLSEGTREILRDLEQPVTIRFYVTRDDAIMPVPLANYANKVEDLLDQYEEVAPDKVSVEVLDPEPFSEVEDSARLDGVRGQPISMQDNIYLGLAVVSGDDKTAIPFLNPAQERTLEYEVTRAISSVTIEDKPRLGIISALPVFGGPQMPPQLQQQMPQQEKWVFIQELQSRYQVEDLGEDVEEIPEDINLLILLHPANISAQASYAVDQFLLRGGKLAVFVDPFAWVAQLNQPQQQQMMMGNTPGATSNLPELFSAWGVDMPAGQIVADRLLATTMGGRQGGAPQEMPAILSLNQENYNKEDVLTADIGDLTFVFPGTMTLTEVEGIEAELLVESSQQTMLVDSFRAQNDPQGILADFQPTGEVMPLAIRLSGKFPTAYPDGKPKDPAAEAEDAGEDAEGEEENAEQEDQNADANHLTTSRSESSVIIVADADFLFDAFSVQIQNILGNRIVIPVNGNLTMGLNIVDQLAGDQNLIKIRSRGTTSRPFTVIQDIRAEAEDKYRERIQEVDEKIAETNRRLQELQAGKPEGQEFILTPEQEAEIEKAEAEQVQFQRDKRELQRQLRQDIESLQTSLKWMNIALMPAIVIVAGVAVGVYRRRRA